MDFAEDLRALTAGFAQPFEVKDSEKLMKRWVAKGRKMDPVDLPPFQRPRELAAWWRRLQAAGVMGKRPPEWMTLLEQIDTPAQSASVPGVAAFGASQQTAPPNANAGMALPPDFQLPISDGHEDSVEKQVREFAQGWLTEMAKAQRAMDNPRFIKAYNAYLVLLEKLRALKKDRDRERLRTGEVLEVTKEREALSVIFGSINKTFTGVLTTLCERLAPHMSAMERRAFVMPLRDKIFAALKGTRFETALTDEQIAELVPPLPS